MMYFKVDSDTYIEFDPVARRSRQIVKSDVQRELVALQTRYAEYPEITDEFLLAWAKEHYPASQDVIEHQRLGIEIAALATLLEKLV